MTSKFDPTEISDLIVKARLACTYEGAYSGHVPETSDQAYAAQIAAIAKWPSPLVGFKVGGLPPQFREQYTANWMVGPIFQDQTYTVSKGDHIDVTAFACGFGAYEAELVFEVENLDKLPPVVETPEAALAFVKSIYLGVEIAGSPNPKLTTLGPGYAIADFGGNAGLALGPKLPLSSLDALAAMEVTVHIDDVETGRASPTLAEQGALGALRYALNHMSTHRGAMALPETVLISSGAITGVHPAGVGSTAKVQFGDITSFALTMTERKPSA